MARVVTLFWPLRSMLPPAETPKFAMVIALLPETAPLVRRARVVVPVGAIAAVTEMSPELEPPAKPMRTVGLTRRLSSPETSDILVAFAVPRSIARLFVRGAIEIEPAEAVRETEVEIVITSACNLMLPVVDVTATVLLNSPPVYSMSPAIVTAAPGETVWVTSAEPT